jgi:opine dehydrogenase
MNITVVGGGNVGTQFAVHSATKGHKVILYTRNPKEFSKRLSIVDENNNTFAEGEIFLATDDSFIAFNSAELIFITVPALFLEPIIKEIILNAKNNTFVGLIPGTGGGECLFSKYFTGKKFVVFGLQRVPSVSRLIKYGSQVSCKGYRKELILGSIPRDKSPECCKIISNLFEIPCNYVDNYLNITLTPSNPLLHTTRLRILFNDYYDGKFYDTVPLFYEDWDDLSSELLLKCDEELQNLCHSIKNLDLSSVKSLKIHYESSTPADLTKKIKSIDSLKGIPTPTIKTEKGYLPDFNSRYFATDFPYGLSIINQVCKLANFSGKNLLETLWKTVSVLIIVIMGLLLCKN